MTLTVDIDNVEESNYGQELERLHLMFSGPDWMYCKALRVEYRVGKNRLSYLAKEEREACVES